MIAWDVWVGEVGSSGAMILLPLLVDPGRFPKVLKVGFAVLNWSGSWGTMFDPLI